MSEPIGPRIWPAVAAMQGVFVLLHLPRVFSPYAYGYDEGVYWQTLLNLSQGHSLYTEIFYSQLPGFAYTALLFAGVREPELWAARLGCVALASVLIPATAWIARQLGSREWALAAAGLTAMSAMLWAHLPRLAGNTPAAALLAVSIGCVLKASESGTFRWRWGLLAALALTFSLQLKPIAIGGAPIAALVLVARMGRRAWPPVLAGAALVAALMTISIIAPYPGAPFMSQLAAGSLSNDDGPLAILTAREKLTTVVRAGWAQTPNGNVLLVPLLLALTALAAWRWREHRPMLAWLWAAFVLTLLPIFLYPSARRHHFLAALPAALLLLAFLVTTVWRERSRLPFALRWAAIAAACVTLANDARLSAIAVTSFLHARTPSALTAFLAREFTPARDVVVGEAQFELARAGFVVPPFFVDTSVTRMRSGALTCDTMMSAIAASEIAGVIVGPRASWIDCGRPELEQRLRQAYARAEVVDGRTVFMHRIPTR